MDNFELEESLAKLSFYINVCIMDKDYEFCKKEYIEIQKLVNEWIAIYAKDKDIKNISKESIIKAQNIFYSIPFHEYKGVFYFEYIDAFLTKVEYFYNHSNNN